MQILANALISGSTYALIGLGFGLVFSTRRFFHVAHGSVITVAPYAFYTLAERFDLPAPAAALLAVAAAGGLGVALDAGVYAPLRRRSAGPTILLIASLGLLIVLQNLLSLGFGDDVLSLRQGEVLPGFEVFGARITRVQVGILVAAFAAWLAVWLLLRGTHLGRAVRAVGSDAELANLLGLPVERLSRLVFFVGSAAGGLAGLLLGMDVGLTPMMGYQALFMGVVVVIVAGLGNLAAIAPAALLVGLTREAAGWWLPIQWQETSVFVILVAFLALRPGGLTPRATRAGG